MLPKKHRLSLKTELKRIKKNGGLFQGKLFSLLVSPQQKQSVSKFAFIISTKIHKKATKRNRARRLLIEAIRNLLFKTKPGFNVVFLAKKLIVGKELSEIQEETERLFRQAGLI